MRSDRHKEQNEAVRNMMESHREEIDAYREEEALEQQKEKCRRVTERDQKQRRAQRERERADIPEAGFRDPQWGGSSAAAAPRKQPSRKMTVWIIVICILILMACGATGVMAYLNGLTNTIQYDQTHPKEFAINSRVSKSLKDYENILILGVDARKGETYKGSRSDAIILARIEKKTGKVQLISIMRDSYLMIEGQDGTKNLDKITHAHAYGGGKDTARALNRSLDLNIEKYVIFNWQAVADLVNAVGGVKVHIDANEIADMNQYGYESAENVGGSYTAIHSTGDRTLNGAEAVTYCRIRKHSGGDPGRGSRYKEVMNQILKAASGMKLSQLNALAADLFPELRTNIKKTQMLAMATDLAEYQITKSYGWPKKYDGRLIDGVWYAIPVTLKTQVQWLHQKAFGQENYTPTSGCMRIYRDIAEQSGINGEDSRTDTNLGNEGAD